MTDRKFYLPGRFTNDEGSLPVAITTRIGQSGRPLMSNPDSFEIISKSDQRFRRKRFCYEFLYVCVVQKAPIHQSHVNGRIKISRTNFGKGHPMNISVTVFQNLTSGFVEEDFLRISSCLYGARSPIHQSHVNGRIKISRTSFEKRHPRNIPVKLFQIRTSGFREDFSRIYSCPYCIRSPHSLEPCFWTNQEEKIFKELLKKFHFVAMATRVFDGIKFCEQFLKRTTQGTFLPSLVQIGPTV